MMKAAYDMYCCSFMVKMPLKIISERGFIETSFRELP